MILDHTLYNHTLDNILNHTLYNHTLDYTLYNHTLDYTLYNHTLDHTSYLGENRGNITWISMAFSRV